MNRQQGGKRRAPAGIVLAVAAALLAVPWTAASDSLVPEAAKDARPYVDAGTVSGSSHPGTPSTSAHDEATASGPTTETNERCLIDLFFCWFTLKEKWQNETRSHDHSSSYSTAFRYDNRTGYYARVLNGSFYAQVAAGTVTEGSHAEDQQDYLDFEHRRYSTNIGYSTETLHDHKFTTDNDYWANRTVSALEGEAHLDGTIPGYQDPSTLYPAPVGPFLRDTERIPYELYDELGGEVPLPYGLQRPALPDPHAFDGRLGGADAALGREQAGAEDGSIHEDYDGSERDMQGIFGVPIDDHGGTRTHALDAESKRAWNRTLGDTNVFLVHPLDNSRIEIIGVHADKGNEQARGESEGHDKTTSYQGFLGMRFTEDREESRSASAYDYAAEWMRVTVDVANATVLGTATYPAAQAADRASKGGAGDLARHGDATANELAARGAGTPAASATGDTSNAARAAVLSASDTAIALGQDLAGELSSLGTHSGASAAYEHGRSEASSSQFHRDETLFFGIPFGSETRDTEDKASSWRTVDFAFDAANGLAHVDADHWDVEERREATEEDSTIAFTTFGSAGAEESDLASDGTSLRILLGQGRHLDLTIVYVNQTSRERSHSDTVIAGSPLFGQGSEDDLQERRVEAAGASPTADSSFRVFYENKTTHEAGLFRIGGKDFVGTFDDDSHEAYGADTDLVGGLFAFHLEYAEGTKNSGLMFAGTPFGQRDDYRKLNAETSGSAPVAPLGIKIVEFGVSHSEESHDERTYVDGSEIIRQKSNTTEDRVSVVVLSGVAGANADRSFSTTQTYFGGSESETLDTGSQSVGGGAYLVPVGGADASLAVVYADIVDSFAFLAGLATWCIDPGPPVRLLLTLLTDTAIGVLPSFVKGFASAVLAVVQLLLCFFAPAVAPLFLLSPEILVPIATALTFALAPLALTLGVDLAKSLVVGQLPAGQGEVTLALDTAKGAGTLGLGKAQQGITEGHGLSREVTGPQWLVIPAEARNPQPALAAIDLVLDGPPPEQPVDHRAAFARDLALRKAAQNGVNPGPLPPSPQVQPTWTLLRETYVRDDEAVQAAATRYDAARAQAYAGLDAIFNADALVRNPAGLPDPRPPPGGGS